MAIMNNATDSKGNHFILLRIKKNKKVITLNVATPLLLERFDLLKNRQIAIEFQHGESPLQGDNQFIMKLTSCQIEFKYIL